MIRETMDGLNISGVIAWRTLEVLVLPLRAYFSLFEGNRAVSYWVKK
ncbi:hypothetical protein IPA_01500 [Ignicoccus pacificus DSM 13166]|uniref:Uncharacterized protein n=1 Tax=Ignicoccus pacificus DSM 13166 TaxID=940294 RepID=A0A977PKK5_9CREN|nr:hypothetical protein IPA_01500 [Ignicoccus pacificus DSM 13166]